MEQTGRTAASVRQRLLTAAEDLFYAHGIALVGVDAVTARAGVATASLYKNFGGKDDLVAGYLQARDGRWRRHWEGHIHDQHDPRERVLALFTALETWTPGHGPSKGCAHLAALQQLPQDHPGAVASRSHKHYLLDRLHQLLTATGDPEPQRTATDLLLIYEGTLALQATGHGTDAARRGRRLADRHLDHGECGTGPR